MKGYKIEFRMKPCQYVPPKEPMWSFAEIGHIRTLVQYLLKIGAISECLPCKGQYISRTFLVPKSDGTFRMILNLKSLNKFIICPHFKLENQKTVS